MPLIAWCDNISFADENVKVVCVANWDTSGDGELSYAEAEAVKNLGTIFKYNTDITSFDELQHFTGLTFIGGDAFSGCTNLTTVKSYITDVFETGKEVFCLDDDATLYVPYGLSGEYSSTEAWNYIQNIIEMEPEVMSIQIACNSKGNVNINGGNDLTGNIALVNLDNNENTFIFTPKPGSKLEQVVLNGIDITTNVENNMLTCTIPANSQMIVTFASDQGDVNNDGLIDISDVVSIVNKILGN